MFIIKKNEKVIYGPAHYNLQMFKWVLINNLKIDLSTINLPSTLKDNEQVSITPEVIILPVKIINNPFDPVIEQQAGPFWSFTDSYAEAVYTSSPKSIESVKNELKSKVAKQRYEKEISGIEVNNLKILTDRESQTKLNNVYVSLKNNFINSVDWKTSSGNWETLSVNEFESIVLAVSEHVQVCFTEEKTKCTQIDLATSLSELKIISESLTPTKNIFGFINDHKL